MDYVIYAFAAFLAIVCIAYLAEALGAGRIKAIGRLISWIDEAWKWVAISLVILAGLLHFPRGRW